MCMCVNIDIVLGLTVFIGQEHSVVYTCRYIDVYTKIYMESYSIHPSIHLLMYVCNGMVAKVIVPVISFQTWEIEFQILIFKGDKRPSLLIGTILSLYKYSFLLSLC